MNNLLRYSFWQRVTDTVSCSQNKHPRELCWIVMEENLFTLIGDLKKVCEVKTGREMVFEEEKGMRKRGSFCGYRCQKQSQKAQRCCLPLYCSKYTRAFGRMVVQHNTQRFCGYRNLVHILLVRAAGSGINISLVGRPRPTSSITNAVVLAHSLILMTFWDTHCC